MVKLLQHKDKSVRNTASWLLSVITADVSIASQLCTLGYDYLLSMWILQLLHFFQYLYSDLYVSRAISGCQQVSMCDWSLSPCSCHLLIVIDSCVVVVRVLDMLRQIQQSVSRQNPFAEIALSQLYDVHLTAKYAYTGFLGNHLLVLWQILLWMLNRSKYDTIQYDRRI